MDKVVSDRSKVKLELDRLVDQHRHALKEAIKTRQELEDYYLTFHSYSRVKYIMQITDQRIKQDIYWGRL